MEIVLRLFLLTSNSVLRLAFSLFAFEDAVALIGHYLQLKHLPGQKPPSTIMVSPRTRPGCARGPNPSLLAAFIGGIAAYVPGRNGQRENANLRTEFRTISKQTKVKKLQAPRAQMPGRCPEAEAAAKAHLPLQFSWTEAPKPGGPRSQKAPKPGGPRSQNPQSPAGPGPLVFLKCPGPAGPGPLKIR